MHASALLIGVSIAMGAVATPLTRSCPSQTCNTGNEGTFFSLSYDTCITPMTYGGAPVTVGTSISVVGCSYLGNTHWSTNQTSVGTPIIEPTSGLCLDAGSNPHNGGTLKLGTCHPGLAQQSWIIRDDHSIALYGGNQCIGIQAGSNNYTNVDGTGTTVPAGVLQTSQCSTGDTNQAWGFSPAIYGHGV